MPARPVIVNNTPLVALWVLDHLDLLRDLYDNVFIPPAVQAEFLATEPDLRQSALNNAPWIKTVAIGNPQRILAYVGLGQGEAEVLALAEELRAGLVILDERRGRRYAARLGLSLTGTIGLLLLAKEKGLISVVAPLLTRLEEAGLHLGSALLAKALELAGEADLPSTLP